MNFIKKDDLYTFKFWHTLLLVILVLSLIPLIWISFYNRPLADDFGYGTRTYQTWIQTHNVFSVLRTAAWQAVYSWKTWQGSYTACFLFALMPGIWSDSLYVLSLPFLVGFYLYGNFSFFRNLFQHFRARREAADITAILVALLGLETLPNAFQSFAWWNGSIYYTFYYSLLLVMAGWYLRTLNNELLTWKKTLIMTFMTIMIGGGNLVTALINLEFIVIWIFFLFFWSNTKRNPTTIFKTMLITLATLGSFLLNAIAPGNAIRQDEEIPMSALDAITESIRYAHDYISSWTILLTICALAFAIPFIWKSFHNEDASKRHFPLVVIIILSLGIFASSFTPTFYAMSNEGPRRIQNIRYFLLILLLFCIEFAAVRRVHDAFANSSDLTSRIESSLRRYFPAYVGSILLLFALLLGYYIVPEQNRNQLTTVAAIQSLRNHEAAQYGRIMTERNKALASGSQDSYAFEALTVQPKVIYLAGYDMESDPHKWPNDLMEEYYQVSSISLDVHADPDTQ